MVLEQVIHKVDTVVEITKRFGMQVCFIMHELIY